jgi:hypothetical protein
MRGVLFVAGGLAVVAFFIVRQRRSDRFRHRSLAFPIGLGVYGAVVMNGTAKQHPLTAASALLLLLSAAASVVFGLIRARTIDLFVRDGELWERATWATIAGGWGGLLVTRVALIAVAAAMGAQLAASPSSVPLMLGVTLTTQAITVGQRARGTGVAIAPSRRDRRRSRRALRRRR